MGKEISAPQIREGGKDMKDFEIRKSKGLGFNVYRIFPDGFTMFSGNFKTRKDAKAYCRGLEAGRPQ